MSTSGLSVSAGCRGGQSLEALLKMSASQLRHADIAEMNLLCATGLPGAENLSVGRCLATLDAWARRVRRETDRHLYRFRQAPAEFSHSEGYFRMLMLVTVLQQDFGVRYNPDRIRGIDFRDSRDLFIHGLLDEPHTGTCASMPVLYVAAGRRLGYPLKLVLTHGHIFARWEGADGRDRFNVECASRGMLSFPDEYYTTWPTALTDEQVRRGRYLLSLGAAEELAVFVESRGHCLLDNGRIREARMAYEHACRLDPLSPGHWTWLDDARVREASRVADGGNLSTFSNWGCSMTISCLPIANSTLSAGPVRAFPLDSTRYRNYHPTLGRWIERDPAGYVRMGLCEYAASAPPGRVDPLGLMDKFDTPDKIWNQLGVKLEEPSDRAMDGEISSKKGLQTGVNWNVCVGKGVKPGTAKDVQVYYHETVAIIGTRFTPLGSGEGGMASGGEPAYFPPPWDQAEAERTGKEYKGPKYKYTPIGLKTGWHNLALMVEFAAYAKMVKPGELSPCCYAKSRWSSVPSQPLEGANVAAPGSKTPIPWQENLREMIAWMCKCESEGSTEPYNYHYDTGEVGWLDKERFTTTIGLKCVGKKVIVDAFAMEYWD
jgi:hypothetical protein